MQDRNTFLQSTKSTMLIYTSIYWFAFVKPEDKFKIEEYFKKHLKEDVFVFPSYLDFYTKKQGLAGKEAVIVILDNFYWSFCIEDREAIHLMDASVSKSLQVTPKEVDLSKKPEAFSKISLSLDSVHCPKVDTLNLYKHVLATYDTEVFFEPFNTFKYKIDKEFRKEYEELFYNYFAGILDNAGFLSKLKEFESRLKSGQKVKYQQVKTYLESDKCEILRDLVQLEDDKVIKQTLARHRLDYFDLNYLRAFLRDFGKPKSNTRRKHNLKLENQGEDIVNINEFRESVEEV